MKKTIAWLLALCLCISLFPVQVIAAEADSEEELLIGSEEIIPEEGEETVDPNEEQIPDGELTQEPNQSLEQTDGETNGASPVIAEGQTVQIGESVELLAGNIMGQGYCGTNLTWVLDAYGALTVSGTGDMTSAPWLEDSAWITSAVIGAGVTSIVEGAFSGCRNLESITIPFVGGSKKTASDTFQYPFGFIFGSSTYAGCIEAVQSFCGSNANYATTIKNYQLPASLKSVTVTGGEILLGAFRNCSNLESITIPNGVAKIGDYAFQYCTSLRSVNIPDGVAKIGTCAFRDCCSLVSIHLPDTVASIGSQAFYSCSKLADINIPNSVTSISSLAFSSCSSLTSITVPDSTTDIASNAFQYCAGLVSVSIGKGVKSLDGTVFKGCISLASISIDSANTSFVAVDGVVYNKSMSQLICYPANKAGDSYVIPDTVTGIGTYAFSDCSNLESLLIPAGVTTIGMNAFQNCISLRSISLPDNITSISMDVFQNCTGLESVSIGKGTESIYGSAFRGCSSLASFSVAAANANYTAINGVLYNKSVTELVRYAGIPADSGLDIPDTVTTISEYAFSGNSNITSITIPSSVTNIAGYAFHDCNRLISVIIPESVTTIDGSAFWGCSRLESITIPFIGNCGNVEAQSAPYYFPFGYILGGFGEEYYETWPTCYNTSGHPLVLDCYIPNSLKSVTVIGGDIHSGAFFDCAGISSITLSNAITFIEDGAFQGVTAEIRYPCDSPLTEEQRTNYGGELTWVKTHSIESLPGTEATCTASGLTTGERCSACNIVLTAQETVPSKGHTEVEDAAVAPTCTESGKTAGKHCSVCDAVLTAQEIVPAKGHTEVEDEAVEPTCTESGKTAGKHCSVCNAVLTAQEIVPAKGHTEVEDEAVEPTCTESGKTAGKHCSVCNAVLTVQETVPAKGHTEVADEAIEPTCTESGKTAGKHCSVCNVVLTAQEIVPAKGHTEVEDAAVEPTCTETGLTAGKHCSVCDAILTAQEIIPELGHDFSHGQCTRCGDVNYSVRIVGPESVIGGKSVTLEASLEPTNLTGTTLIWKVIGGEDYAVVTGSGAAAVLKTKAVTETQTVTLQVTAADGEAVPGEYSIKLTPGAVSVRIKQDNSTVTGKTVTYNLRDNSQNSITFSADVLPADAAQNIKWTSSDTKAALCIIKDNGNGTVTVYPTGKAGTVTLTAAAADGSKKKSTVKVKLANLALLGELEILGAPEAELQGRQTLTLKTSLATLPGLSDRKVVWSLGTGESAYASITSAGKLTVNEVGKEVTIHVTASASANPAATATVEITLKPLDKTVTSEIRILHEGAVVNNSTLVLDTGLGEPLQLSADVYPAGAGVVWKSSSAKIATVSEDGTVTGIKAGTVTITATADDGSKVYGSVKVTVQANVYAVTISNTTDAQGRVAVTAGKSITLKAAFEPAKPTNSKVTWSLRPEDAPYATISAKGVLKAAKVTGIHTVQATVTSQADPAVSSMVAVTIYPAATAVNVTMDGVNVSGAKLTHSLSNGTELQLAARTAPYFARNDVTWKSSSAKLAKVDETGKITFTGVTGKVTITCTAADDSGKKTTITFTVTK